MYGEYNHNVPDLEFKPFTARVNSSCSENISQLFLCTNSIVSYVKMQYSRFNTTMLRRNVPRLFSYTRVSLWDLYTDLIDPAAESANIIYP